MSVTLYLDADLGAANAGLPAVGYKVLNPSGGEIVPRTTAGVAALGGGCYGATVTVPDGTVGTVIWDAALGSPVYASERIDARPPSLGPAGLDSVNVEGGLNARQALSVIAATLAGVLSGAGTAAITIRAAGNPGTTRVTATVTGTGDRTAVTLTPPP